MKYIFLLVFIFPMAIQAQYIAKTKKGKVEHIEKYKSLTQLDSLLIEHKVPALLIIHDQVYLPDQKCLCNRDNGSGYVGRISRIDKASRSGGVDDMGRSNDGSSIGRNHGSDNGNRNNSVENLNRDSEIQNSGRNRGWENEIRNSNSEYEDRLNGNDYMDRESRNDLIERIGEFQSLNIQCKKNKKECNFELMNLNPYAKIKVYNGVQISEIHTGFIIDI